MEDKRYYTMLYEATYPDSGVISYKPVKVIKGFYNPTDDTFKDEETDEIYASVNMTIPTFGKDQDHILDALSSEIETYDTNEQLFYAFPIEEERALEYCDRDVFEGQNPMELYEREVRGYFLYSVYDGVIGDNIFYVIDKLEDHNIYNVDVSLEIVEAVATANNMTEPQKQLLVLVAGGNAEDLNMESLGLTTEEAAPQQENKPDTAFKEVVFDFDPDKLEDEITSEVIGQDHVVRALVSMMYKNKRYHAHDGLKSNMLILGPSGCGKTEIVRSMSRHLNIPMTIFDATSASASGYVGNSVTQAIKDLISVCNGDVARAEHGIIVIDEIDKLASIGSDGVSKGDVQDELFKMLEGDEVTIAADNYREKSFRFNPKNVTFIGIGSAQALIEQKKKDDSKRPIGFGNVPEQKKEEEKEIELTPEDLIKFGLKPELLRRLNIIKVVKNLKKEDLVTILTDSKISNLRLYEAAFRDVDHVSLVCSKEVLDDIADKATKEKAGASGLKRVVDDMLQTSVRKIRMLQGKPGELVLFKETIDNPEQFELYSLEGQNKEMVYPPKVKVKK